MISYPTLIMMNNIIFRYGLAGLLSSAQRSRKCSIAGYNDQINRKKVSRHISFLLFAINRIIFGWEQGQEEFVNSINRKVNIYIFLIQKIVRVCLTISYLIYGKTRNGIYGLPAEQDWVCLICKLKAIITIFIMIRLLLIILVTTA